MSDDVQFVADWNDEATMCKNCRFYQEKEGKYACVPEGKTFEEAIEAYGEVTPNGHCSYFEAT